ncbi:PspA/IM30 family protein [Diaphorobacter ruginosibacter]|jgi:phage shock protein A|uniref:PspA/IM30 family protein n=1 Tax=Diaphorobacter ruginosibacter TaxID=1715720 RepID=A0A7G9RMJ7_9BURK|nr:PspA/IM30 family protein [Diaphorobacter ruginosibacter]MDR2336353.1 PspA/IM30 family protein [Burkholderiaceae bacterium]QNN56822.1 PspA/IM30 family protein [Diaphorobacter ruginosibacter]
MAVWNKLVTALRGAAHEAGEAVTDSQALRILDQEIRDADNDLNKSKEALAEIMAKQKLAASRLQATQLKIGEYEGYALKALETNDETLALEVAGKVSLLEAQQAEEESQLAAYTQSVDELRHAIQAATTNIKRLKQQADTVKATESVQRAQATVAGRYTGSQSRVQNALDSLERIKQKQAERGARLQSAAELAREGSEDALDAKLRAAGITPQQGNAQSVLERLKAQKASAGKSA